MADTPYVKPPPDEEDLRHDELDYDPSVEPKKAQAWLNLLEESEKAFEKWNTHCDNIDKQYASLDRLSNMARDREFQMFWANCEVLKPSIYARAPVPVVVPKFAKDRRPVYAAASEVMERCCIVSFDLAYINDLMLQLRDDLTLTGRGVPWCRYESGGKGGYYDHEKVCIDFKYRRDFLHSISRNWSEVTWVAAASYLTRDEARDRFKKYSGACYQDAEYEVDRDLKELGGADNRERAKFWEIWHKGERRVVWVACGCEDILDESDPHLELECFFPCPKPVYGTLQRGSLVPVPDVMQYKDQLEEINMLTGRIHALSDAIEAKGFYPAGGGELADAIQTAVRIKSPGVVMVPISNWAAFGGSKETIIWMPIGEIASTITVLIETRKQVIDDIYQIMGLSDIMRGATNPQETLGAQELKTQYGSTRIRDKQYEMQRVARDLVGISSEIITEKFDPVTIIEMSQTQLPTNAMQQQKMVQLQQKMAMQQQALAMQAQQPQQPQQPGQPQQSGQADPQQQMSVLMMQAQAEVEKLMQDPTIEQVLTFLKNNKAKSFVLDIETDSTIMPNENAEKQRTTEFIGMLAPLLQQLGGMIEAEPQTAEFAGEVLKFATAPFRAGRSLNGAIDDMVEMMKAKGGQSKGDDPQTATGKIALQIEGIKDARERDKNKADAMLRSNEIKMRDAQEKLKIQSHQQIELAKLQSKQGDDAAKMQMTNAKAMAERESHQMDMVAKQAEMRTNAQKAAMAQAAHIAKQGDMAARQGERQAAMQFKQAQQPPPFGA